MHVGPDLVAPAGSRARELWRVAGLPVAATAATLAVRLALEPVLGGEPTLVVFTVPIMLSGYLGGLRAGLLATALSGLAATYFLLPPLHSFAIADHVHRWQQILMVVAGIVISALNEALHRAGRRADGAIRAHAQAEAKIARQQRLYATLTAINQRIVRNTTRSELFAAVCRVLVEKGGLRMAWVGWDTPGTRRLMPVGAWGDHDGYVQSIAAYSDDRPEGRGPMGLAFRTGEPHICNEMLSDPATLPWRAELAARGFRAAAAFPIRVGNVVRGILVVYSDNPAFFQEGEVSLLAEAAADVSFALDNLRRDEGAARLAAIVESSGDAIVGKDLTGCVTSWNMAAQRLFGYTAAEMVGESIRKLIPPDRQEEEDGILARVTEGGTVGHFETVRIQKDGHPVHVSVTVSAIRDANGSIVGASKTARDVTVERRTKHALASSEMRYRRLFEAAQDGILILDAETGRVVDVNPFLLGLIGHAREEVVGRAIWELGMFDDVAANAERFSELKAVGYVRYQDLPLATRSGGRIEVEFISNVYEVDGGQVIQCNVRDVSARRAAEREVRALNADLERRVAERTAELLAANRHLEAYSTSVANDLRVAEAADRLKSTFLATMSHELRTPLNSILGFTGIVLQGLAGPLTAEQTKQLGMVRGSARHLLDLINDVLDLSKIEAGQLEIRAQAFDVHASVALVLASVRPLASGKGLELTSVCGPLAAPLVSDRRRVEQILLNLLSNAIKFTDRGGVTLTVDVVGDDRSTPSGARFLRLQVADTGVGITPADLATLFQPFRQLDNGLARQSEGTGLGLAICRRLATLLGGEVSAASEPARGSVFALTLPLEEAVH